MLFNFPANSENELHKNTVEVTFPNVNPLPASRHPITRPPITPPTTVQPRDQSTLPDGIDFPPLESDDSTPSPSFSSLSNPSDSAPTTNNLPTGLNGSYWTDPTTTRRANLTMIFVPATYDEISSLPESEQSLWKAAISSEINSLTSKNTFSIINHPPVNTNIVDSKWVFKVKYNTDGSINKYKEQTIITHGPPPDDTILYGFFSLLLLTTTLKFGSLML